jgi:16S rRNA (guanine966-N2)-methyltransferase
VTRIIAGTAGGRTIKVPPGSGTRPTSDRVREALFSSLEARDVLRGAAVLDLYAGSGALGLEAASRGAARVVLVESDRRAAALVSANARSLGLRAEVATRTVRSFLSGPAEAFDLVVLDPPYPLPEEELAADLSALVGGWLTGDALVVVERSSRSPEPTWPEGLARSSRKAYGETTLWLAQVG